MQISFSRAFPRTVVATLAIGAAACGDNAMPTKPNIGSPTSLRADQSPTDHSRMIRIMDECDRATFDAAVGAGTCLRTGGVKFDKFVAELTRMQVAPEWRFSPDKLVLRVGDTFGATNGGGEMHSFTEVAEFGGGIVPFLNDLAGTPNVAPECRALQLTELIAPGASVSEVADEAGDEKYQCCIHPWMRATVHIAAK
jgi:hypothetical protein